MNKKPWEFENSEMVLFWGGVLSNWYKSDFEVDGTTYNSVEQHMMAEKARQFNDTASLELIMASTNPRDQKMLGRGVAGFDATVWTGCCLERCLPGIRAKFMQNESLAGLLQGTGSKVIAEASPYDKIWGIGLAPDDPLALDQANWAGANFLGELLMIVRDEIRSKIRMRKFKVKAQGYGGSGPSVASIESSDIAEIKNEIADLINSDHAVQLYEILEDGTEVSVEFEAESSVAIYIEGI